ncbi:MAG: CopG family transcriptional regulator [Acidobacteria bacterium]|nr:CopG family transcriptional regulator [Acidobacteriota bacterium]
MRTTLDIDEDILRVAKDLAGLQDKSVGKVLSELARKGLKPEPIQFETIRGVPMLPPRADARLVTLEDVKRLLDEEDS